LVSLALITIELETRKKEEEKQSKRKSSNEHKCLSLSSHYLIGVIFGLGRGFDLLFVSLNEVWSSCMRFDG
jgi:F0F1-type ATP synthase assembly protein I